MIRATLILALGGFIGSVAVTWFVDGADRAGPRPLAPSDSTSMAGEIVRLTSVAELLSLETSAVTDRIDLDREIARLAVEPGSALRDLSLEALIVQLAEIDAPHAVRTVQEHQLGQRFLVPLFRRWTELDADAALAALASLDNLGTVRAIALELIDILGGDARSIERLAELLPDGNRTNFDLAVLEHRISTEPASALADAVALSDPQARESALLRIAFEWGNRDPRGAMDRLDLIPDRHDRREYFNYVLTRWARLDPASALQYAETADDELLEASFFAIQTIINRVPADVLASASRFPPQMRTSIESYAARVLVEQDPALAISMAQGLPIGQLRQSLVRQAEAQLGPVQ